ncbi:MAG: MBL fold metallo-hydrolase [Bacteroidota bacterium]
MKIHTIDLEFLTLPNSIAAFLVETSAGPVLIETGPHSAIDRLTAGIRRCGYEPSQIRHVLLTHIHFDHAGAAWYFAKLGAQIYVHPFGYPHLQDPSRLLDSARRIYQDQMDVLWGKIEGIADEQMQAVDNGATIQIGETTFTAWYTPGHARHHIAWQCDDVVFTGDVAGVSINKGMVVPPCPPPDINLEDWAESIALLRKLEVKAFYLTHYGEVTEMESHLQALEFALNDWAQWMKKEFEAEKTLEETVPKFQAYVAGQLREYGLDEDAIKQYEAANPSWMSVAGLFRYWKKRSSKPKA